MAQSRRVNPKKFFGELKRRNVYKVAITYVVVAWLLIQLASILLPTFEAPSWVMKVFIVFLAFGFVISAMISWAFEATPEGLKPTKDVPPEVAAKLPSWSRRKFATFIVVVAAIAAALFAYQFLQTRNAAKVQPGQTAAEPTSTTTQKSIAVLPFSNLSHDPDNAYFAAGIQDEIITRLAKIGELKVVSCLSTQRFKSAADDLPAIAKQLGVANLLQGSVQRSADAVRVNVQLVKAETENRVWADTFDRKVTDVFQIESDIAKTIAEKLQAKLTGSEERAISVKPTADVEAHQLYLQGRYLWNRRTAENLKKALSYFEQAAEKDSGYALAYAGIADTCVLIPTYGAGTPQEYLPRARAAAEKALELDNDLAEAHASLGYVLLLDFKRAESAKEYERAIALNPNYATAHQWYGTGPLAVEGKFDQAIAETKRAAELDPISPILSAEIGRMLILARRYPEAISQLRNTVELYPEFYWGHRSLGYALELSGAPAEAINEYQKAFQLNNDPVVLAMLGHAKAATSNQTEARRAVAQLNELGRTRYVSGYAFAVSYLAIGDRNEALSWIEKAAREPGDYFIQLVAVDPYCDSLRGDQRFEAVVRRMASE
jgi:TolB-like protein